PACNRLLTVPGAAGRESESVSVSLPEEGPPITVSCPCGQESAAPREYAGQQLPCPACNRLLTIPPAPSAAFQAGGPRQTDPVSRSAFSDRNQTSGRPARSGAAGLVLAILVMVLFGGGLVAAAVLLIAMQPEESPGPD